MSATITIQLSPSAIALADKFKAMPQEFPKAIKRGMDKALAITSGRIQEKRLTGHGPFPVAEHRLGERTVQLKLRTRATEATIETAGNEVVVAGAIGSSVFYAKFHEFGYSYLARFKRSEKAKKAGRATRAEFITRRVRIPERAPFRTGITENIKYIADTIEAELMKSLKP